MIVNELAEMGDPPGTRTRWISDRICVQGTVMAACMSRMWTRSKELFGKGKGRLIMSWNWRRKHKARQEKKVLRGKKGGKVGGCCWGCWGCWGGDLEGAIGGDGLASLLRRDIDANDRCIRKFSSHFNGP